MMTRTLSNLTILVYLVLVGVFGWWLYLRPSAEVDPQIIEQTPVELSGWVGTNVPISKSVERILRADAQLQRVYQDPRGELVSLYVGYYGTRRGGRPEHTPWECYPSAGWTILSASKRPFRARAEMAGELSPDPSGGELNELVVELGAVRDLVHFWYSTHRSHALATESALTFDHTIGRFSPAGRADGALVRISTRIDELGVEAARARLARFKEPLMRELRDHWPRTGDESTSER